MNSTIAQARKTALVTGGARRVGAAIVKTLHQAGYKVLIHCRHAQVEAEALARALNGLSPDSAMVVCGDLTEAGLADKLVNSVKKWTGRLDVLVNNASIFQRTDCLQESPEAWEALFAIHVRAPFVLSLACRTLLAKQQGCIINITDIHAERPLKGYAVYCQSKAALEMQTKSLALEFAPDIRVNAVAPGPTIWPEPPNELSAQDKQAIIAKTLLKREGDPLYVAQAVLALAQNAYMSGQIIKVDGGRSLIG